MTRPIESREMHPVMFKSNPLGFVIACLLIPIGLGIVILLLWNLRCRRTFVKLTDDEIIYHKSTISVEEIRVRYDEIANVIVGQTVCTRKMNAGNVLLVTNRGDIVLEGMPSPGLIEETVKSRIS